MTVATLQYPRALNSASWITRYPLFRPANSEENQDFTFAYVTSVVLGFVIGLAIAIYSGPAFSPSAPFNSETASTSASGMTVQAATVAGQAFSLTSQAVQQEGAAPSAQLPAVVDKSATGESTSLTQESTSLTPVASAAHPHHGVRKVSARRKFSARLKSSMSRGTIIASEAPAPVAMPQVREAQAARPVSFMIEGDVSVADYDASAGMIETHEGKTFTIARSGDESNAMPWPDSLSSVHYRCDQSGNCTLSHAGLAVSNVRVAS